MRLTTASDKRRRASERRPLPTRLFLSTMAVAAIMFAAPVPGHCADSQTICAQIAVQSAQPGTVVFADSFESGNILAWADTPSFSATEIIDVDLVVGFDGPVVGEHLLELRVTTPHGHAYQTLTLPISSNRDAPAETSVGGFPKPLRIHVLEPAPFGGRSLLAVTATFPVGGTSIATGSLFGLWSVEPFLDGESVACGQLARFVIID